MSADENLHTTEAAVSARNDEDACTVPSVTSTTSSGLSPLINAESPVKCRDTESPAAGAYRISAMETRIVIESGFAIADHRGAVVLKSAHVDAHVPEPTTSAVDPPTRPMCARAIGAVTRSAFLHDRTMPAIVMRRRRERVRMNGIEYFIVKGDRSSQATDNATPVLAPQDIFRTPHRDMPVMIGQKVVGRHR